MSKPICALLLASVVLVVAACGGESADPETTPAAPPPESFATPEAFLAAQEGKVVVLVLGMESCAGTRAATRALAEMAPGLPPDVAAARLDVPPPGGTLEPNESFGLPIHYGLDADRTVARSLDFFYYPTTYVLDREGEVRFAGAFDRAKLSAMIGEIRAEKAGDEKKVYTAPLPSVGSAAPVFTAAGLDGEPRPIGSFERDGPTLLFFTSIGCPFSAKAARALFDVEIEFEEHDVAFVTVEKSAASKAMLDFHEEAELPGTVVLDPKGEVSHRYGVEPVPFFFVIDGEGTIAARGPYTEVSVRNALRAALGIEGSSDHPGGAEGAG